MIVFSVLSVLLVIICLYLGLCILLLKIQTITFTHFLTKDKKGLELSLEKASVFARTWLELGEKELLTPEMVDIYHKHLKESEDLISEYLKQLNHENNKMQF